MLSATPTANGASLAARSTNRITSRASKRTSTAFSPALPIGEQAWICHAKMGTVFKVSKNRGSPGALSARRELMTEVGIPASVSVRIA